MLNMENAEEVMQILERFTRLKQKEIPKELDDYMHYVAKTGDTVFKWSSLKYLFREKLLNVIKNFHDTSPRVDDLPQYPNVDPFNYESMKSSLLERLELFNAAPFTVQRLCELLTEPRKQYSRIDKFMRALEKNILVSTIEPGRKQTESENGDSLDSVVNGDVSLDVNVDIEMENETTFNATETPSIPTPSETPSQPTSYLIHKADDDILPNPKKAKLDIDEMTNDAETVEATKSISSHKPEQAKPSVDNSMEQTTTEILEKKNEEPEKQEVIVSVEKAVSSETVAAEPTKKENTNAKPEKMEEDTSSAVKTDEDNSKPEESEKKIEDKNADPVSVSVTEVAKAQPEQIKKIDVTMDNTDTKIQTADKMSSDKIEDSSHEVSEDKKTTDEAVQNGDSKPNVEKTENKETKTALETAIAPDSSDKIEDTIKEKTEDTTAAPASAADEAETTIKTAAKEQKTVEDVKSTDESITSSDEIPKSDEKNNASNADNLTASVEEATNNIQVETLKETPQNESVTKEDEVKSTEIKEKETDKPEVADAKAAEAEAAEQQVVAKAEPVVDPPSVEATPAEPTPIAEKSVVHTTEVALSAVVPPEDEKLEEIAKTTPAVATTTAEASTTEIVTPRIEEEQAITADQPMEENPESIVVAEPVVPTIIVEAAATVEEVVMGDSAEMATDAIEPAKDEPAGMEVDDTSQEAMDQ